MVAGKKKGIHFDSVLEKIGARIQGWSSKFISQGGKIILIRHVLVSIHCLCIICNLSGSFILRTHFQLFLCIVLLVIGFGILLCISYVRGLWRLTSQTEFCISSVWSSINPCRY